MPEINERERGTINTQLEPKRGTARVKLDQFKVSDPGISRAVIDGLTAAGYDMEIAPGFNFDNPRAEPEQRGDILTIYQKVR